MLADAPGQAPTERPDLTTVRPVLDAIPPSSRSHDLQLTLVEVGNASSEGGDALAVGQIDLPIYAISTRASVPLGDPLVVICRYLPKGDQWIFGDTHPVPVAILRPERVGRYRRQTSPAESGLAVPGKLVGIAKAARWRGEAEPGRMGRVGRPARALRVHDLRLYRR